MTNDGIRGDDGDESAGRDILLRSQKNELFRDVEAARLDPSKFSWVAMREFVGEALRIDGTPCEFQFIKRSGLLFDWLGARELPWRFVCFPGLDDRATKYFSPNYAWIDVARCFASWIALVKHEMAPDLWVSASQETPRVSSEVANEPLNPEERIAAQRLIAGLRESIVATGQVTAEALEEVNRRLQDMQDSADRLGKKDWLNAALGAGMGAIVSAALPPEVMSGVVRTFFALFNSLLVNPGVLNGPNVFGLLRP